MSNKLNKVTKLFEGDLTDWKPIPFWSWNDRLEPEELCRQIDWMNENGIGGFLCMQGEVLKPNICPMNG